MEDCYVVKMIENKFVFAVFDGHMGGEASKYLEKHFAVKIEQNGGKEISNEENLKETIAEMDVTFLKKSKKRGFSSGSTICTAMIDGKDLIMANVGDSRAVAEKDGLISI